MIDLLTQVFYVFAVLAVISLFVCTLPAWLIVLVVVLLLGVIRSSPKETNDTSAISP
jgi:predicted membrane protein